MFVIFRPECNLKYSSFKVNSSHFRESLFKFVLNNFNFSPKEIIKYQFQILKKKRIKIKITIRFIHFYEYNRKKNKDVPFDLELIILNTKSPFSSSTVSLGCSGTCSRSFKMSRFFVLLRCNFGNTLPFSYLKNNLIN